MKTILITYVILINLISFILMGIDKQKARRRKWRVSERTLFLLALFFGSIGILVGMHFFHHKTKKLRFSIGIPVILAVQLLLLVFLFSWNRRQMQRPVQAVQNELQLIQNLDTDTIQSFVSYENLMNSHLASGEINDDTAEAVRLFFQNFTYSIQDETIDGDTAVVTVRISNLDAKALAHDLCAEILRQSAVIYPGTSDATTSDYYALMRETLLTHTYETVDTAAEFHLYREESGWAILSDSALEDELVGGFISYMNDPYLLSASETLSIYLDALKALTADQWKSYLNLSDVFGTYNATYSEEIDDEYVRQLAASFDWRILRCTEEEDNAEAVIRITSIDMEHVLTLYRTSLLKYAATTKSIRDSSSAVSDEMARLLLEALQNNTDTSSTDVTLSFSNDGFSWEVYFNGDFTNALMGDMQSALDSFRLANQKSQEIDPSVQ